MDFLTRKRGIERFVLIGVCSGALIAHRVAVREPRVVGTAMLDGYAYRTRGYWLRHYSARLLKLRSWLNVAHRAAERLLPGIVKRKPTPVYLTGEFFLKFPPLDQVRAELQSLLQRGTECFFLYTGGIADLHLNHRRQFKEMFGTFGPAEARLQLEYLGQADHLFSAHAHRQLMFARIESWMQRCFGANNKSALGRDNLESL